MASYNEATLLWSACLSVVRPYRNEQAKSKTRAQWSSIPDAMLPAVISSPCRHESARAFELYVELQDEVAKVFDRAVVPQSKNLLGSSQCSYLRRRSSRRDLTRLSSSYRNLSRRLRSASYRSTS